MEEDLTPIANEFILTKLCSFFNLTESNRDQLDKFKKSFEGLQKEIQSTLYQDSKKAIVFGINKDLCVINPKDHRRKNILVLKSNKEETLSPDMEKNFVFLELNRKTLEELYTVCKDIFFPMLTQSVLNNESSELISKELMEKFHNFLSHYNVTLGHVVGETRLPEPSDEIFRNPKINDNEKTQICEGAVVMWIDLIKYILKQEPEHEFRNNGNPLPSTEIDFWRNKSTTLKSIMDQIEKEKIREILEFLIKQKSAYHNMFTDIKEEVKNKEKEAKFNYKHLLVLEPNFNMFGDESKELVDIVDEFVPTFHIIRQIWMNNPYYKKPERLIVLIRKLCNAIIEKGVLYIRQNIFSKIIDDSEKEIVKLEQTREIIQKFIEAYFKEYKPYQDKKPNENPEEQGEEGEEQNAEQQQQQQPNEDEINNENDLKSKEEQINPGGWNISRNVIFYRLDAFNDRIGDILEIAKSYHEFSKMSGKTVGGIKGDALETSLNEIFAECDQAVKRMGQDEYDPLDISDDTFNQKYIIFKDEIKELERKISAVLTQAFDENDTIMGKFRVLDNFDTILERQYIVVELEKKYNILLDAYKNELRIVQNLFLTGVKQIESGSPKNPLNKNMPPIAAMLNWTDSLKSRITEPIEKFRTCGKRITEKEEFKEISNSYDSIHKMIDDYGANSKTEWDEKAKVESIEKQKTFILEKKGNLLNVNFDPELLQLLKEVKYLKILNMDIPENAELAFKKNSKFREQISNLENIKAKYNHIITELNEVERPMLEAKIQRVEMLLLPALGQKKEDPANPNKVANITWENEKEITDFYTKVLPVITDLDETVNKLKGFVTKINGIFDEWNQPEKMLFKKPSKIAEADAVSTQFSAYFDQERTSMAVRVKDISNLGEVQQALKSAVNNLASFKETDEWRNYQHYINSIVLNGSIDLIYHNLHHLSQCLDPSLNPFCNVRLLLEDRHIVFRPEFNDTGTGKSIKGMILEWINSFLNLSTLFRIRVDTGMGDFMIEVLESYKIQEIVYKLYNEIHELTRESDEKMNSFNEFKVLWEKEFSESFNIFLEENTVKPEVTPEQEERNERIRKIFNEETNPNPITKNITEYTPTKEIFDDKINEFKDKLKRVKNMENSVKVRWVEVDFSDFKNELTKIIENWVEQYKQFLRQNSTSKLNNITDFMNRVEQGIKNKPTDTTSEEDKKKFFSLLEVIRDMDLLFPKIVELIPSIKGELEVLKKHMKNDNEDDPFDIEDKNVDSEEQKLLEKTEEIEKNIPELKKKVENLNEEINDLIDKEKANFRVNKQKFDEDVENFRDEFKQKAPKELKEFTREEIENAYNTMNEFYVRTIKYEEQMKQNNDMELLLKIPLSKNKQIQDCLDDLKMFKTMWDYIAFYFEIFESWRVIKMDKINVNDLMEEIDLLKGSLRSGVKKEIKQAIPAFNSLLKKTIEMDDTIQAIMQLKEPVIKQRHWRHLNEIIKKTIPYDSPDFSVNSLLELEIYKVKNAVDEERNIAGEQNKIEIAFNKIDKTWQSEKFRMTNNLNKKTYDIFLFDHGQMDLVIENLEKDQNTLIQMSQKKGFLENFEKMPELIDDKMQKLKTVDEVIKQWLKLQKNWEKLEVIFLKSDDIQNKLRNEYTQFKELDLKFREEMKNAYDYNIMIDVCTAERQISINEMSESIATCQNALDNYLETKKKIFPRFYFVSNDTLLNMLASADYPNLINKNVKDCFDGIKNWEMKPLDAKNKSDTILAMASADNGEIVEFDEPFVCQGQLVEIYLKEFEDKMRRTLGDILLKAYNAVNWNTAVGASDKMKDDKIRHTWLNPFPAQLALLVTQCVWTEEVEHALEATDGGEGNALKDYFELCVKRINHLIDRVRDEKLTRDLRVKIITIITVDVHARDVVEAFSKMKPAIDSTNFNWKKQLRFKYVPDKKNCDIQICDFTTHYSFEYIGNTGRLVITPLTDRCYITLTQALNLILGGAPAGPAGTGKTETVKDLGRNLGLGVIVNNCSEQMDIETTARIFSGLSQTGFWGCFDEFNRISIEVLSVVSTQVKTVLDAMRINAATFMFEGSEINLVNTCGFFITMNPGYAGRTELPDNLKALFRSCAMVVPDLREICQNMLMSEGFSQAKPIAAKFITLYTLSRDLLSKQKHYDWGLRAIKSLLRQAGGLKRLEANKSKNEFYIIMRALFDFNKAKIVPDDLIIFERLLQDLFKESDSKGVKEEDINQDINQKIDEATECPEVGLQKDTSFTTKTRQLKEILEVRHCLFILGAPGSGKTSVWKTLFYTNMKYLGEESGHEKLSPKAITGNELFGYIDDKTKAWKYGILSAIMKKMCKSDPPYKETMRNKWIILDGDIDPNWIESLNTVMDDNKVLTLTNGDRFPLDEFMRLLFEVSNLRNATLATVSRGGVLYINEKDIGITPFFDKWVKNRYSSQEHQVTKRILQEFFKNTFEKVQDWKESYVAPVVEISLLQNFCCIFQNLINEVEPKFKDMEDERKALVVEAIYFFSFMWGVGGGLIDRKSMNSHVNASIKSKNKLRFPDKGICFDYFFDEEKLQWVNWKEQLRQPVIEEKDLFSDIIIPNVEVTRLCRITEINMLEEKPVLFVGDPGTGKTAVVNYFMKNYLEELTKKNKALGCAYKNFTINFNSFTNSYLLQNIIDSQITQRFSNRYGPLGNTKLIYFLDDLNMPQLDEYGTQSHVELLRQAIDYKEYFDRRDLEFKKVLEDILFIGCQNPKAGSFKIDLRLQRHFTLIGATEPNTQIITEIYTTILSNHFKEFRFKNQSESIEKLSQDILEATCGLLDKVRKGNKAFTPSATKFHYQWNMREISRVIDGVLRSASAQYKEASQVYKLWYHEVNRVFKDRLILKEDIKAFESAALEQFKASFKYDSADLAAELKEPFIFVPFGPEITDDAPNALVEPKSFELLKTDIQEYLTRYNDEKGDLPLVLFDDAIMDICRISRIICNPCSHALLVGVGGSGKQSLSRLAAFIKEIDFATPNLSGTDYNDEAFLNDIKNVMLKSVLKQSASPYCFLINDNHIIDEYFLVYINNFLSSYWVDEIFETKQDLEGWLVKSLKSTAPNLGFTKSAADYTMEGLYNYLIYRVKTNVHFILCMSPVGDTLRVRARKFPSILNGTSIDWFHEWPETALKAVSARQIEQMPQFAEDPTIVEHLAAISSELHNSIQEFNTSFFKSERRYNYTTPKSFLELVKYFELLITRQDGDIENQIARLEKGLQVVANASQSIAVLKEKIEKKSVEVEAEQKKTNEVLAVLEVENEKISGEKKIVEEATAEAQAASAQAEQEKAEADKALAEAEPAKVKARSNAENIKKDDLEKFKNPNNPSMNNFQVFKLVYLIFNPEDKMPSDDIKKELPNIKSKCLNQSADQIKAKMIGRLDNITWVTPEFLEKVKKYREYPYTDLNEMAKISGAVKGIVGYFQNVIIYNEKYLIVQPLLERSQKAAETAAAAMKKKEELEARLEAVSGTQRKLQAEFDESKANKEKVEREQAELMDKLNTAEKFIGLLASNNKRWKEDVIKLKSDKLNIAGDCLLGSSFVSYIGVFNSFFREKMIEKWISIISSKGVQITPNIDLVHTLVTEGDILKMKAEGLPSDPFSTENAVIITQCTRYPLIIDPQMQAIAWLKNRPSKKTLVQYKQPKWDSIIGEALGSGEIIIIEDVDQEIDPMLAPIMGKQTTNKDRGGRFAQIRVGSSDYPFDPNTAIYFLTKISNPHYKPEIMAQCTLVNFIVTEKGLEDQLLAMVVNIEQPDLEEKIRSYINEINELQAELINKEDDVLKKLSEADEATILDNKELIGSLETTKGRALQIEESSKQTEELIRDINEKREIYRGVGEEGAMLFFLISKLFVIQDMYQYSLNSFVYFFEKAIANTEKTDNLLQRVLLLREKIRITVYTWISAGMFERDKKLLLTMISIRLLQKKGALTHESLQGITQKHIDFLLKCPQKVGVTQEKSMDFLDANQWGSLCYLSDLDGLQGFSEKVEKEYSTKFKEWYNEINPEDLDLPPEWKKYKKHSFHKILILRACRPERVGIALNEFIRVCLPHGEEFLAAKTFSESLLQAYFDSKPEVPIFFILSPGSNPIKDLEILGRDILPKKIKKKFTKEHGFKYIAMGQNAEKGAEEELKNCNANGEWLFLQNIHLMPKWLKRLEDKMKEIAKEKGHEDFRLYLSAEPSGNIPVGILEKCIKLSNEPPSGLKENMKIAFSTLKIAEGVNPQDEKRRCGVIFGLSYFHAVVIERKKFGSLGWNRNYPFNLDDLRNSDAVVGKYIEPGVSKIPWEDLKYIVGEIMYGGHIVDDMDRILNNAYLNYILDDKLLEDLDLVPYPSSNPAMKVNPIKTPYNNAAYPFEQWDAYIDVVITSESPALFGLHPNAELEYRITETNTLFRNLIDLEPKDSGSSSEGSEGSKYDDVKGQCDNINAQIQDGLFDIIKMKQAREGELTPDQNVFMQECEQMKSLCELIRRNLKDITDAIDGKLTMDERIEQLIFSLSARRVPKKWISDGFATNRGLASWTTSLTARIDQLKQFESSDNVVPKVVFVNRLFNPLSYLTAIRQLAARRLEQELDKLDILTEPSNYYLKDNEPQNIVFKETQGVPIYGLHLQGCRFDEDNKILEESRPKENYFVLPIIFCKVMGIEFLDPKKDLKNSYICPIYKTIDRQSTFVCFAQFKTKAPPAKWTIAGVAVILDCEKTDHITQLKLG